MRAIEHLAHMVIEADAVPPRSSGHVRGQGEPPPAVFRMRAALAKVGD